MNFNLKNKYHLFFLIILLCGAFIRFHHLGAPVFWQDEAETILISQNLKETIFPKGYYKVPFYENAYLLESNSEMYEFSPTNYVKTDMVNMKGWFTYYFLFPFTLLGNSEFFLRFPFALLGVLSLILTFLLAQKLFGDKIAIFALFFQAFSPHILYYERQVRYYSIASFLFLLILYLFVSYLYKMEKGRTFFFPTVIVIPLVLLFHTHILFSLLLLLALILYLIYLNKNLSFLFHKSFFMFLIRFTILTLPWVFFVKFSFLFTSQPRLGVLNLLNIFKVALNNIFSQSIVYLLVLIGIPLATILVVSSKSRLKTIVHKRNSASFILILFLVFLIFPPLLSPLSSFEEKMFIFLIPIFFIFAGFTVSKIIWYLEKRKISLVVKASILILIILLNFYPLSFFIPFNLKEINHESVKEIIEGDIDFSANWIPSTLDFISKESALGNMSDKIFTTDGHFTMLLYSDLVVQTVWPVRQSFLESSGNFWFIEAPGAEGHCGFFYQYLNTERCNEKKNYISKVKSCEKFLLEDHVTVYRC